MNTVRVPNSLNPDQARCYVKPERGKYCLQQTKQVRKELNLNGKKGLFCFWCGLCRCLYECLAA